MYPESKLANTMSLKLHHYIYSNICNMSLRKKTLLVVFSLSAIIILAVYLVSAYIINQKIREMEYNQVVNIANRTLSIINNQISILSTTVRDYGVWDDTYNFIENQDLEYLQSNYKGDGFATYNIDLVYINNSLKEELFSQSTDSIADTDGRKIINFITNIYKNTPISGLYLDDNGIIYMLAAQPISDSKNRSESNGMILMVRKISETEKQEVSDLVGQTVLWNVKDEMSTDFVTESDKYISIDNDMEAINRKIITVRVDMKREIRLGILETRNIIVLVLLLIGVLMASFATIVSEKIIISPIKTILNDISQINNLETDAPQVHIPSGDDYGILAIEINKMLLKLKKSHDQIVSFQSQISKYNSQQSLKPSLENTNIINIIDKVVNEQKILAKSKQVTIEYSPIYEILSTLVDHNFIKKIFQINFDTLFISTKIGGYLVYSVNKDNDFIYIDLRKNNVTIELKLLSQEITKDLEIASDLARSMNGDLSVYKINLGEYLAIRLRLPLHH